MKAKYCIWTVDDKLIKEVNDLVKRYSDEKLKINPPIDLTLQFLYQMLNLSDKHKSTAFLRYRSNNPEDFEEGAYGAKERKLMVRILTLPKVYEMATGHKSGELIECSFEVTDVRAVEQIERLVSKANITAYQGGGRNVAYSDYEVPSIRNSVYATPLAKLRRSAYNWD